MSTAVEIAGFVDHHTHILRVATQTASPCDYSDPAAIADYHRRVAAAGSTPMDEPPEPAGVTDTAAAIAAWLTKAAALGLVEVTEAGMSDWTHFDALQQLRERGPLPARVRILVASGAASGGRMRRTGDPWLDIVGVKFYADGWLGPRTCAVCRPFHDRPDDDGVLFLDAEALARRAAPYAEAGWVIATHAIGDRAIEAVLDAYRLVFGDAPAGARPRIEHAQVVNPELVARMAEQGVTACIQPGFAVSDAEHVERGLGPDRAATAYDWRAMIAAGVHLIAGSDFPIESLAPLVGLQQLVVGPPPKLPLPTALDIMSDPSCGTTILGKVPSMVPPDRLATIDVIGTAPAS